MPEPLRIFIGSSSEGREKAEILQELLYEQGTDIQPKGWWTQSAFPVGSTYVESLRPLMKSTDAALLLATEDDTTVTRGKKVKTPRDNILVEYGLSLEVHGPERTALAVVGNPKLPSGLSGVTHLQLEEGASHEDFKERNRGKIRTLIEQWRNSLRDQSKSEPVQDSATKTSRDTEDALALVNQLIKCRDDLLSNINLVQRYQINRIAIPRLCEKINALRAKPTDGALGQVVTLAAYMDFERNSHWQWKPGYRYHTDLTSADGTQPISGVTEKEREELKKAAGVDPRRVSLSAEAAVRGVSWYDAAVYCFFVGGRLPTKEELSKLPASAQMKDVWEWSQSWFSEEEAHIAVARRIRGRRRLEFIGVNPDLRLSQIGFRVIR